jgi:multidrug efflux system membrane fusion protein
MLVELRGLGTVQAFNMVEIKAQVTGTLVAIPVQEGQEVHQGDIVAQIDPRPYQAALDQVIAQRAEDAAQLQRARLDLQRYQHLAKSSFAPVQQIAIIERSSLTRRSNRGRPLGDRFRLAIRANEWSSGGGSAEWGAE